MPRAQLHLRCPDLAASLAFYTEELGFALERIYPADEPRVAELDGEGVRLRLEQGPAEAPARLRIEACVQARQLVAPEGTRIECVPSAPDLRVPELEPALVLAPSGESSWTEGRAGMLYRDLLPGRLGGHLIASRIRIEEGGPVPDYVHFHHVRFQFIYCVSGWVRLVYEDQGDPFVLRAGDCVLQPPRIRHRVLECSAGLEVIELGCPAEHATCVEHSLELPTPDLRPERSFDGQRFVHHVASSTAWTPSEHAGYEQRELGLEAGTGGLLRARILRGEGAWSSDASAAQSWLGLLGGRLGLEDAHEVAAGGALALPGGASHRLRSLDGPLELFELRLPGPA